jgi:DeoR family glycerol-3-phosphate regulon repressor
LNQRQIDIVDRAKVDGFVTVEGLSSSLDVSPQTVRRDIARLCSLGILRRYHGGASLMSNASNADYATRQASMSGEKARIGQMVAEHIPDGSSLFIDIGTTAEAVAKALLNHKGLRVITSSLSVAAMMAGGEDFEVTIAGGRVRFNDLAVVGEAAIDAINQYTVDFGIIGISGIDAKGTLLDFDYREVRVAQAVIENSRTLYLVTDHTKFGRNAMVKVGNISLAHALFLDRMPDAPYDQMVRASGVTVHVACEQEEAVSGGASASSSSSHKFER